MGERFDVIVLGVGTMGAAACDALARRGQRVLGLEQFDIPHDRGSHHGQSRMFRTAYYEHPSYVPLLRRSLELWRGLEGRSGEKLLHMTGGLYMGPVDGPLLRGSLDAASRHGIGHEVLTRAGLAERFGQFRVPENYVGFWEGDAGLVLCEAAVGAMARSALEHGAELRGRERVVAWESGPEGVLVGTNRGVHRARRLVIAAGAWTPKRLALDVGLVVTRQVVGWVWPKRPELFGLGALPCWALERPEGGLYYGFPMLPGRPGMKLALHEPGAACDPETIDRGARPEDEGSFRPALEAYLPDADGPLLSMGVCMYTSTADQHFIVDRHPGFEHVVFACGFSGHGFKFAPVIGEVLADLAMEGETREEIAFLRLNRGA